MDVFQTTVTVIDQVYTITIFIRGVVRDYKAYAIDKADFQMKLQHEFVFVDHFKSIFFDNKANLERYDEQPPYLKQDVFNILTKLRSYLHDYSVEAAKHGMLDDSIVQGKGKGTKGPIPQVVPEKELRKRVHQLWVEAKETKKKAIDWALFDKARIEKNLARYGEWTERLRQIMPLMLPLTEFGGYFADTEEAKAMGLLNVAKRRALRRREPPAHFRALTGTIGERPESSKASTLKIVSYSDVLEPDPNDYAVEYRHYSSALKREYGRRKQYTADDEHEDAIQKLKAPMRDLAWKLHDASFPNFDYEEVVNSTSFPPLLSLRCFGYVDQPEQSRAAFLYELPATTTRSTDRIASIDTLHTLIGHAATTKPSLGNRFFLAYALANTILNVHVSGWVHKNICSHVVAVFCASHPGGFSTPARLIPSRAGGGGARPSDDVTELVPDLEIEPNLYRHPARQRQPTDYFCPEHDYFALGAVLIEIGLWTTLGMVFEKQIAIMTEQNVAPRVDLLERKWNATLRAQIETQMGEAYAEAIDWCLTAGNFLRDRDDADSGSDAIIEFRKKVVEILRRGTKM